MNILHINGDVIDVDQIASKEISSNCVRLRFRNGDEIPIFWRDDQERRQVLSAVSSFSSDKRGEGV